MRRLLFGGKKSTASHPLEKGDLCLALPPPAFNAADSSLHLATVVSFAKKRVVFFDDGFELEYTTTKLVEAPLEAREAAKKRYAAALLEAHRIAAMDMEEVVEEAIQKVRDAMGGTLGADGMISYTVSAGDESKEGRLLCEALLSNFGALTDTSPAAHWMSSHWREVCEEADADKSGTISSAEAIDIWDRVSHSISQTVAKKLDILGMPPRLYRGDLCLALPIEAEVADPVKEPDKRHLATYVDATHVTFFDGVSDVSEVRAIEPVTPAAKEQAVLRYTKAVSQCKAAARKPSDQVVKAAIASVRESMGGTLGADNAIDYTAEAGDESREGMLLLKALVGNFGALKSESKAVAEIESNWKVACAQADADSSGTISLKEAIAIWDRIIIEMTRTLTSKLDTLGVNPVPLVLEKGDLCMVKPAENDTHGHSDPKRLYLATYVDESHAIYFDDASDEAREVSKVGPATAADKDVATVKYSQALQQCMRLAQSDAEEIVHDAIEEVKVAMGGTLGKDGKISYLAEHGDEAKEAQLLCEELVTNLGALWDESRSVVYMTEQWRETCKQADEDKSGTISEEEAVEIWGKLLGVFTKFVAEKLQKLGVASRRGKSIDEGQPIVQSV